MAINQKNYFKFNKENADDKLNHYYNFKVEIINEVEKVRRFIYLKHEWII